LFVYLTENAPFPAVEQADEDGILAIGGDLSPARLLSAYRGGIFPWFSDDEPIIWWAPDPRFILKPDRLHISKNLQRVIRSKQFHTTRDHDFEAVITACRHIPRPDQPGTWITQEMQAAYIELHKAGHAHSIEVWQDSALVGGLYGVVAGGCFCGESMFATVSNASKIALVALADHLKQQGFLMIDSQVHNDHMERMGAELTPRHQFMQRLKQCLELDVHW
jgi:leucyl/phenylalanyl-tRNA--protein transferase